MTHFDRLLFLDADTLILGRPDRLICGYCEWFRARSLQLGEKQLTAGEITFVVDIISNCPIPTMVKM